MPANSRWDLIQGLNGLNAMKLGTVNKNETTEQTEIEQCYLKNILRIIYDSFYVYLAY